MLRRNGIAAAIAVGVLVTVGYYKAALGFFPVDATAAAASVVGVLCVARVLGQGLRVPGGAVRVSVFFGVLVIPCVLASFDGYSTSKIIRLFSVTFIAAVAPAVLIRTRRDLAFLLHAVTAIGILVAMESLWSPPAEEVDRLATFGSNTISLGRATGLPAAWLVLLAIHRRLSLWVAALLLVPVLMALVGSGSRGPLLAMGVSLLVTMIVARPKRRRLRTVAVWAAVIGGGVYAFLTAPEASTERLARLGEGGARFESYRETLAVIARHPLGVGWGDWGDYVVLFAGRPREYPHNLALEVFAEGGWLVGIALMVMLWQAFRRALAMAKYTVEGQGVLVAITFATMNAMVSGDINDNRLLWVAVGLAFVSTACASRHPERPQVTVGIDGQVVGR